MIISQEKRKENIAEYMLYMFQIEDTIRAFEFNIDRIESELISQYKQDFEVKREIREWYKALISMMTDAKVKKTGHIPLLNTLIKDMNDVHYLLLESDGHTEYKNYYASAKSALTELKLRGGDTEMNDIEAGLNGLYGFLLLKIQHKEINPETSKAFGEIATMFASLSESFRNWEEGKDDI
ncbi:MAG: DUF4924 family protein [Bacteroidales bacterium]|nr:DUF4924 family protein [Bacteroidales bacterium]MCF8391993.1 DUF4924 family protein [Bacteroidales bacterium]